MTQPRHTDVVGLGSIALLLFLLPAASDGQDITIQAYPSPAATPNRLAQPLSPPEASPMAVPKPQPDGQMTLHLKDGSKLIGQPMIPEVIRLKAEFGEVEVPARMIEGIRFPDPGGDVPQSRSAATLLFRNSDVLHGQVQLDEIELEAPWGKVQIASQHVQSIIFSAEPYQWHWNGRWRLDAVPVQPNALSPPMGVVSSPASASTTTDVQFGPY